MSDDEQQQAKYFPETVQNPGKKKWSVPDVLATHMNDPILINASDDEKAFPELMQANWIQDEKIRNTLEYHLKWAMWLKFDLTSGEIHELCRKAGKGEYEGHLRSYYDNVRMQIFERLEWMTKAFLDHPSSHDPDKGWLRPMEGNKGGHLYPRYPIPPTKWQINETKIITLAKLKNAWVNIDILVPETWKSNTEHAVLLAACRTACYIIHRAAYSMMGNIEEDPSRAQKTALYFSLDNDESRLIISSVAAMDPYSIYLTPFPRANVQKHPALYPRVTRYPRMDQIPAEGDEMQIEAIDLPDDLEEDWHRTPSPGMPRNSDDDMGGVLQTPRVGRTRGGFVDTGRGRPSAPGPSENTGGTAKTVAKEQKDENAEEEKEKEKGSDDDEEEEEENEEDMREVEEEEQNKEDMRENE